MSTAPSDESGLRERKKRQTRHELERVAFELFSAHGYDGVTIDEIAAGANVSKRTFYRYFESKDDVLLGDRDRQVDALRAGLAGRPLDEPLIDALRRAFQTLADEYGEGRELLLQRAQLMMATPSLAARMAQHNLGWERMLAIVIADRIGVAADRDPRPQLLASVFMAVIRVTLERWVTGGCNDDLGELIDEALGTLAGLSAEAAARPAAHRP